VGMSRFLTDLYQAVESAIKRGDPLDELVTFKDGKTFSTSVQLPENVHHWISEMPWKLPRQVMDTYEEITQHKPRGAIAANKIPRQ
jgi:hypothetical protein